MEKSVAIFSIVNFTIIGMSHFFEHQAWKEFFIFLGSKGKVGAFANGFLTLFMGAIIVAFHNVWSGLPMLLTLMGWAFLTKSVGCFLFPDWNVRSMQSVQNASAVKLRIAGIFYLAVAALLGYGIASGMY